MKKGICHLSQIPLRGEPRSGAEMISQLLYGETYDIIRQEEDWFYIKMDFDDYEGWLSHSSIQLYENREFFIQSTCFSIEANDVIGGKLFSSMGSELIESEPSDVRLHAGELAKSFLGTPYLWGGRHFSGIDCSGFVQVIYKCLNISLPRDASQQQKMGKPIAFDNLYEGDLVFFEKNERITHVGLVMGTGEVIHAHGMVRIDKLTKEGVFNADSGLQTHFYHSAKRLR